MKKTILTILLTLCVVGGAMPSAAWADVIWASISWMQVTQYGDITYTANTASVNNEAELKDAINDINNNDVNTTWIVRLANDIEINSTLSINSKTVTLDLNGYVLSLATGKQGSVIQGKDSNLTITDSRPDAVHKFTVDSNENSTTYGLWTLNELVAEGIDYETLTGGVITGGNAAVNGGGIYVDRGSVTMKGVNIAGCRAQTWGGGIYVGYSTSILESCSITGCVAEDGGGVKCDMSSLTIDGTNIRNCTATGKGGGVFSAYSTLTLKRGEIAGCTAKQGGGVFVDHIEFTMNGGRIADCRADEGSGIYFYGGSSFNAAGGEIGAGCDVKLDSGQQNRIRTNISGGTFYVDIENKGTVSGGIFYGKVINKKYSYYDNGWIERNGTISGGCFYGGIENDEGVTNTIDGLTVTFYSDKQSDGTWQQYAGQVVQNGSRITSPAAPAKAGYTFGGWYKESCCNTAFDFESDTITGDTSLYAKWKSKTVYGGSSIQRPTVTAPTNGTITLSANGRTAAITPDAGYEIAAVKVNGEDKGAVSTLTGLRTGDRIEAVFSKTKETLDAEVKDTVAGLSSMQARTSKTSKGNIKVLMKMSETEEALLKEIADSGYTVKYRFYRSGKKSSGYHARIEKDSTTFINTAGKKNTRYYYKVQVCIYDTEGKQVAKTEIKDCKYATRIW